MSELCSLLHRFWKVDPMIFRHVVADDLAQCKHCKFYCNYSSMKKALGSPDVEKTCPMCEIKISLDDIIFLGENGVAGLKKPPPPKDENKEKK